MSMNDDQTPKPPPVMLAAAPLPAQQAPAPLAKFKRELEPQSLEQVYILGESIVKMKLGGIETPEDAVGRIMFGRELGLSAMQSIRGLYLVNGRFGMDASLMHALCMQHPECEEFHCVEETNAKVVYHVKRRGRPRQVITWTDEDVERALLANRGADKAAGKDGKENNHNKYPKQMKHARCKADGARREFADVLFGVYSREEFEAGDVPPVDVGHVETSKPARYAAFEAQADALKARIAAVSNAEQKDAVRQEIKNLTATGELPEPWMAEVIAAYSERFAKRKADAAPAASPPAEPPPAPAAA